MIKYDSLQGVLSAIVPDPREETAREAAHGQWATIAKPLGSLGEGTGAVAAISLLDMALYSDGAAFAFSGIEAYRPQGG